MRNPFREDNLKIAIVDGNKIAFDVQCEDRLAYNDDKNFHYIGKGKVYQIGGFAYSEEYINNSKEVHLFKKISYNSLDSVAYYIRDRFSSSRWPMFNEKPEEKRKRVMLEGQMNVGVGQAGFSYRK